MYREYWGLKEKPFENTPDPRFMYHSSKHEEAFTRLLYAVQEKKGAALLSGEYGAGKTLLSRCLWQSLMGANELYKGVLIVNPAIPKEELLSEILYQFGCQASKEESKSVLLHKLNDMLYKNMENKKHSVLIIDEAQAIEDESMLEELRLLLNFQLNDMFLFTLVLIGQPELNEKINKVPQFRQRLAIRYHLDNLDRNETKEYIVHRLNVAGRQKPAFSDNAIDLIYNASGGIPREINNICDLCLVIGMGQKSSFVEEGVTCKVIKDLKPEIDYNNFIGGN